MTRITRAEWEKLHYHGYTTIVNGKRYALINSALVPVIVEDSK